MAAKKTKMKFDFMPIVLAMGGGAASAPVEKFLTDNVFSKTPTISPLVVGAAGSAMAMFGGDIMKPIGLGMVGASSKDVIADLLEGDGKKDFTLAGFSRVLTSGSDETVSILGNLEKAYNDAELGFDEYDDGTE